MGGYGSGHRTHRPTVESESALSVTWILHEGWFQPGTRGTLTWHLQGREEKIVASVGFMTMTRNALMIIDHLTFRGKPAEDLRYAIQVAWTPCHYGGERPWWICPNPSCGRRVATLYLGDRYFLCRHCYRLVYASSQASGTIERPRQRIEKLRQRLGVAPMPPWGGYEFASFVDRPRYMHHTTYRRIHTALVQATAEEMVWFSQRMASYARPKP